MYDIFKESKIGDNIDMQGFADMIGKYGLRNVTEEEIRLLFNEISKGKQCITF